MNTAFTDLMTLKAATGAASTVCLSCGQHVPVSVAAQHAATCKVRPTAKETK